MEAPITNAASNAKTNTSTAGSIPTQSTTKAKPLVLLVFGGVSAEHEISCATAGGVLRALNRDKWDVYAVGISEQGYWMPMPLTPEIYDLHEQNGYRIHPGRTRVALVSGSTQIIEYQVDETEQILPDTVRAKGCADVAFSLLHGPFGEDGTIQGLFEIHGLPYVGCGVNGSAISMDKVLAKTVIQAAGIPGGRWLSFTASTWAKTQAQVVEQIESELQFPVFVKPSRAGSSIGVSKVEKPGDLSQAIEVALRSDPRIIVEQGVVGREVECGVLQYPDGRLQVGAVGEITVTGAQFYDYRTKYFAPEAVRLSCPADVPDEVVSQLQDYALRAFQALECEGLGRFDFFYNDKTGEIVLNEVNTMPGFTPFSMYPTSLEKAGVSYADLVDVLLEQGLKRGVGLR